MWVGKEVVMLDLASYTPVYISFILTILLWKGLKAKDAFSIRWKDLIIIPVVFLGWTIYSTIRDDGLLFVFSWIFSLSLGVGLELLISHKSFSVFDKKKKLIEFPGSWVPMILLLFIFSLRVIIGVTWGEHPDLKGNLRLFIVENLETILSAMFLVKLVGSKKHLKSVSH